MITMKRISLLLVLLIGLAASSTAHSQQPTTKSPSTTTRAADTLDFKLSPELKKSLGDLAAAVQALAIRITSDPEVKAAAMQVASGVVMTAQQVVVEQSAAIADALKAAAERISAARSAPPEPLKKP
jgi:hypothetical protein